MSILFFYYLSYFNRKTWLRVFIGDIIFIILRPKTIFPGGCNEGFFFKLLSFVDRRSGPRFYLKGREHARQK